MDSAALMKRASCRVAILLLAFFASSSVALATNLAPLLPLTSVPNPYAGTSGTVSFAVSSSPHNLSGTIDYGVFLASDFNAAFPANPQPGAVVYAYQIFVQDTTVLSDISHLSLAFITDPLANNFNQINSPDSPFTGFLGTAATSIGSTDEEADWFFGSPIQPGFYSKILVYSSPYLPTLSAWTVQDGGLQYSQSGFTNQLPVPGSTPAPEPGTITLVVLAGLFGAPLMVRRIRRRRS
jgi:hypothetical protein